MLSVLKNSLVTGLSQQDVMIRKKELDWLAQNYSIIATQAAVMAGFAFRQIMPQDNLELNWIVSLIYILLVVSTLGLSLYVILVATLSNIFAKGMALRGALGFDSMKQAIHYLRNKQEKILSFYILGLVCLLITTFITISCIGTQFGSIIRAQFTLLIITMVILISSFRIHKNFYCQATSPSGVETLENRYKLGDLDAITSQ